MLSHELRQAIVGGVIVAAVGILGTWGLGSGSGGEMRVLLEAMLPSTRFLCSAVMTATATILSLMLTLLGFSGNFDKRFDAGFYQRVRTIALADTIVFAAATLLLLLISVPLNESDKIPAWWFSGIYYVTLVYTAVLGGALITIVLLLYSAVKSVIAFLHPEKSSNILSNSDD